jgi:deoxycytidine triphosphate deaminase
MRNKRMVSLAKKIATETLILTEIPPLEVDPHPGISGVLLSDEITYYAQNRHLIVPFDLGKLKPAGYELTVGNEYFLSGEFHELEEKITIPPFEVAVLKTGEIIRLPRFMIARWNIRVKHAYSGLLWVGGPQVDPGYVGFLLRWHASLVHRSAHQRVQVRDTLRSRFDNPLRHLRFGSGCAV